MAIVPGRRLGPYEILSRVSARGMDESYRAADTKLGRAVALKIRRDGMRTQAHGCAAN